MRRIRQWKERPRLLDCPLCKEKSVVRKVYDTERGEQRGEWCINEGCGYRLPLPLKETYLRKEGEASVDRKSGIT